jgi:hypothetical protein
MGVFGGVVRQFVVDDKGCVMIAAFGLPQYSYEVCICLFIFVNAQCICVYTAHQLATEAVIALPRFVVSKR